MGACRPLKVVVDPFSKGHSLFGGGVDNQENVRVLELVAEIKLHMFLQLLQTQRCL